MCTILIVLDNWCVTFQRKGGRGVHALFFCYFCDSNFLCKAKYFVQSSCRRDNQTCWQINHTIVTWVFEGADVIYFPSQEEGQYCVDISWLLKDLLYKDIPLTLYFRTENVMDSESVFIAWDHNGMSVKYLHAHLKESMFWMSLICMRIYCTRTSRQSFMLTIHGIILTQYGIC